MMGCISRLMTLLVFLLLFSFAHGGMAGVITTVAGGGTGGDGGPATAATLSGASGIAVDTAGNLYIAGRHDHRIRKVDGATGIITTVAGNGIRGYSGDGGPATAASLSNPLDIAVDAAGNLYIADAGNNRIRKVDGATGEITTVAGNGIRGYSGDGGPATAANLFLPSGVAVDTAGNLYIIDAGNNRIRKVDGATGVITTVAGDGTSGYSGDGGPATAASLGYLSGIAVDTVGNLYIADKFNHRIRKVDGATGIITTVAGGGTGGDSGPATAASLRGPSGIAVDTAGNLYIADADNGRIRKVDGATGVITTVAGDGTYGFSGDGGPATAASLLFPSSVTVDTAGNLYLVDEGNHRIRKVDGATGVITTVAGGGSGGDSGPATAASLLFPSSVTVDTAGNLYIAGRHDHRIRKVDGATGIITTVAGDGIPGYSGDGGPATAASLRKPSGIAIDTAGNLYIADSGNHRIRKVDGATGIITTVAGDGTYGFSGDGDPATAASLYSPSDIAVDTAGNLYIADSGNNRIRKVDGATGVITTVAGDGTSWFSGDGDPATAASLNDPSGIAVDAVGNLYIADKNNDRIRKVDGATGVITTVAGDGTSGFSGDGGPATAVSLSNPLDVAVDAAGNLYIADEGNNRIRKVDAATGVITTVAGDGTYGFSGDGGPATAASLNNPSGIAVDAVGNLYIVDEGNNRIRKVTPGKPVENAGDSSDTASPGNASRSGGGVGAVDAVLLVMLTLMMAFTGTCRVRFWKHKIAGKSVV